MIKPNEIYNDNLNETSNFGLSTPSDQTLPTILVVDDDRRLRDLLTKFIKENHYRVISAASVPEARSQLAAQRVDLIVLDIMMPGESGIDLAASLRATGNGVPILFLTAKDTLDDRIHGLNTGGDDYLTKPFDPPELLARMRAILRRTQPSTSQPTSPDLKFGDLHFSLTDGALKKGEEGVLLSSTEVILLRTLAQSPGQPFSREDLAQRIGHRVTERAVDVQITRLRKKMGDDPRQPRFIQTIRHIGYALCPE